MVQEIGAITVRGNHDEAALERYQSWKLTGTLDVSQLHQRFIQDTMSCFSSGFNNGCQ